MPTVRPKRLPLSFYSDMPVQYVAPWGDDSNDGFDFRYPKKTFLAAYDFAFQKYGSCEFHVAHNTYVGGANQWSPVGTVSVPGQGIWLDGRRLVSPAAPLYPGCRVAMKHRIVGYPGINPQGQMQFPQACLLRGLPGDVTKPSVRFDVGYWITDNNDAAFSIENIFFFDWSIGIRIAVNQNPAGDPDAGPARTDSETVSVGRFEQCVVQNNGADTQAALQGPGVDCGYYLWVYWHQCSFNGNGKQTLTADNRAGILIKPSGGASTLLDMSECRGNQGGLIYYCGSSTWGLWINNYLIESDGHPLPAVVKIVGPHSSGYAELITIQSADDAGASEPTIDVTLPSAGLRASQIVVIGSAGCNARGTMMVLGSGDDQARPATRFNSDLRAGYVQGKWWGDTDAGRWGSPPVAARWRNACPQHSDDNGITGPIEDRPIDPSPNVRYTAAYATGPQGVVANVRDHAGGNQAFRLECTDGGIARSPEIEARQYGCLVGERFAYGFWVRTLNGANPSLGFASIGVSNPGFPTPTFDWKNCANGDPQLMFQGDGEWQWYAGGGTVTNLNGGDGTIKINWEFHATAAYPFEVCFPVFVRIPATSPGVSEISDGEFGLLIQNMPTMPQTVRGFVGTQLSQVLCATGGLALGASVPIAGHSAGSVVRYQEVFDSEQDGSGNRVSLGYIEIKTKVS